MTDAEKVSTLRNAIERADKVLDWILAQPGHSEWMMTTASRVRRILRAAIKKIDKDKFLTADVPGLRSGTERKSRMKDEQNLINDFTGQITKATIQHLITGTAQTLVAICTIIGLTESQGEDQKKNAMDGICDITNELYRNLTKIRRIIGYQGDQHVDS